MRLFRFSLPWSTVIHNSLTVIFVPAGDFVSPFGYKSARAESDMRGKSAGCEVQATLQFSDDLEGTNAVLVAVGQNMSADQFYPPSTTVADILANCNRYRYVRPGWHVKVAAGQSGTVWARVGGVIELTSV